MSAHLSEAKRLLEAGAYISTTAHVAQTHALIALAEAQTRQAEALETLIVKLRALTDEAVSR